MTFRHIASRLASALCALLLCAVSSAQTPSAASSSPSPKPDAVTPAGKIDLVTGEARLVRPGTVSRRLVAGDIVSEGDLVTTSAGSEVQMTMQDTGFIALRANTRMRIDKYKADGAEDDKAVFRLLVGGMRSVTGWIGKFNQTAYVVRTPSATIGIRGTDHETRFVPAGSADGEAGTYDKVFAGGTTIQAGDGKADVAPDQAGFVAANGRTRPRVLERVPVFFVPGPNEAQINRKHAEIQAFINQRRDERRKVISEKRAELDAARTNLKATLEANKAAAAQRQLEAQKQRQETQQQQQLLKEQRAGLKAQQAVVQQQRSAVLESLEKGAVVPHEQRRTLRQDSRAAQEGRIALEQAQKRLVEQNAQASALRRQAAQAQSSATQSQIEEVRRKRESLQKEIEATQLEIKTLREEEQNRFRAERRADRVPVPAPPAP